jgi:hypothetical protein
VNIFAPNKAILCPKCRKKYRFYHRKYVKI